LVAHWDDDWMASGRLAAQVAALTWDAERDLCGLSTIRFFDPVGGFAWEYRYPPEERSWVHGATMCYRSKLWKTNPFPELDEGEDTRFVWSVAPLNVLMLPDVETYAGLVHSGNASPKRTNGLRWKPIRLEVVREQLGGDWRFYEELAGDRGRPEVPSHPLPLG
jgi:hypothetical protein